MLETFSEDWNCTEWNTSISFIFRWCSIAVVTCQQRLKYFIYAVPGHFIRCLFYMHEHQNHAQDDTFNVFVVLLLWRDFLTVWQGPLVSSHGKPQKIWCLTPSPTLMESFEIHLETLFGHWECLMQKHKISIEMRGGQVGRDYFIETTNYW